MVIKKSETAIILTSEGSSVENFFIDFSKNYTKFKSNNVILDFSETKGVTKDNILLFSNYSEESKLNGTSFVIVVDGIDVDTIPEEILTVPTVSEAKDIIEMENIERDLGF